MPSLVSFDELQVLATKFRWSNLIRCYVFILHMVCSMFMRLIYKVLNSQSLPTPFPVQAYIGVFITYFCAVHVVSVLAYVPDAFCSFTYMDISNFKR